MAYLGVSVRRCRFCGLWRSARACNCARLCACASRCLLLYHWSSTQMSVKNCFIRGSVVRYVQLPAAEVDTDTLQDACRRDVRTRQSSTPFVHFFH